MKRGILRLGFEESVGVFPLFWLPISSCMELQAGLGFTLTFSISLLCGFQPQFFLPSLEILFLEEMCVRTNGLCTICQREVPYGGHLWAFGTLLAECSQGQSGLWDVEGRNDRERVTYGSRDKGVEVGMRRLLSSSTSSSLSFFQQIGKK